MWALQDEGIDRTKYRIHCPFYIYIYIYTRTSTILPGSATGLLPGSATGLLPGSATGLLEYC